MPVLSPLHLDEEAPLLRPAEPQRCSRMCYRKMRFWIRAAWWSFAVAMVCTLVVSAFIAGSFHAQRGEHGLQVVTWHDAYGTMHLAHTKRVGSVEEQRLEAHKTEVLRLKRQLANLDQLAKLLGYSSASDVQFTKVAMAIGETASGPILRNLARSCGVSRELACQASQSSDIRIDPSLKREGTWPGSAQCGVDGDAGKGDYFSGKCTHTPNETSPWWMVDLQATRLISAVRVYNRKDCCSERLQDFEIRVGHSSSPSENPVCAGKIGAPTDPIWIEVPCFSVGRYVSIILPGPFKILTVCEVQVLGSALPCQGTCGDLDARQLLREMVCGNIRDSSKVLSDRHKISDPAAHTTEQHSPSLSLSMEQSPSMEHLAQINGALSFSHKKESAPFISSTVQGSNDRNLDAKPLYPGKLHPNFVPVMDHKRWMSESFHSSAPPLASSAAAASSSSSWNRQHASGPVQASGDDMVNAWLADVRARTHTRVVKQEPLSPREQAFAAELEKMRIKLNARFPAASDVGHAGRGAEGGGGGADALQYRDPFPEDDDLVNAMSKEE